ncbi:carboxypeptidase-like regulatory domain-containing protein [Hymenobacter sediminicola]|uniref:Carboxypeptidase-like regulatory domain-containing protein n=1 Tax=Hymenobacter sediminicola TaxID=2761579 RepID=A0A7G7W8C0_9BACT|nr:carboxypeptidase-like regulatory domain-containing protein [Hymenobacter sediminicola]QNH62613.1 carboxypeptidase-like regulatory domain-containing protein [Hymenobacter sediminicola]
MKLTASPFDPQTGELLPVYRDAYLNGDLTRTSAQAVESYLRQDADQAHETLNRWQELQATEAVAAPTWVQKQVQYIRAEPVRFRRRATTMVASAALLGTMVFAGTKLPTERTPTDNLPTESLELATAAEVSEAAEASVSSTAAVARMITVRGRILNEAGSPLVGATVLNPGSRHGVSTNSEGEYVMQVPAGTTTLKYGYGGYQDEELVVKKSSITDVTLQPQEPQQKRRWWQF